MTNLIDRMDQVAEALKAAGDDIASRRVANARRDRIRGLITPAAADAALSVAEKRIAHLAEEKARVPGAAMGRAIAEAEDRRSEADAERELIEKLGGAKIVVSEELPAPRPLASCPDVGTGFVLRQGDPIAPALPDEERFSPKAWADRLAEEVARDRVTRFDRISSEIWAWLNRYDAPWSPSDAKVSDLARRIDELPS